MRSWPNTKLIVERCGQRTLPFNLISINFPRREADTSAYLSIG
jgi:hypothetical protein